MNHVVLIGRLTRDPEVRYSNDNMAIARFSIAIDRPPKRDGTKEADFPSIVVFGKQAESCEKYIAKGRLVAVEGRIQTGSYVNKEGNKVYTTEVIASRVEFLEWGDRAGQGSGAQRSFNNAQPQQSSAPAPAMQSQQAYQPAQPEQPAQGNGSIPAGFDAIDDDDIPF
ncbi:MAG: single-stranded DNA-binding protein [Eubacteriaceae bacterium]|nr:single-stranded DNA-binding protein [Eubacteriaceae bacterium]